MKNKLPKIEMEDIENVLKKFNELGVEKFTQNMINVFEKENPLILTQISEADRQMEMAEDIERAKEVNLICALVIYATLNEAMKFYPTEKSCNDKLPTVSDKIVFSTYEHYVKKRIQKQFKTDLAGKLRRLKAENSGINLLLKTSLSELEMFLKMFKVDDKFKSLIYGFVGTHMLLVYEVLEAQAECNKLQKLFGDLDDNQHEKQ